MILLQLKLQGTTKYIFMLQPYFCLGFYSLLVTFLVTTLCLYSDWVYAQNAPD